MLVKYSFPNNGYDHDQITAREHLELDKTYEVKSVKTGRWHTDIYLKDFPGVAFNSVLFEKAKNEKEKAQEDS